ncbi:MAG: hypothetical protein JNM17_10290 [Archangium sp.]|nr:hypothetical protein [Archangium sp.]
MSLRVLLGAFFVSVWLGCQCGPAQGPCVGVKCAPGLTCDPGNGRCIDPNASGGGGGVTGGGSTGGGSATGGGSSMGTCSPACSGTTPICDPVSNTCKTCTDDLGCSGATPVCQPISNGGLGKCVVCTVSKGCVEGTATPACDPTVFPNGACVPCVKGDDCPVPGSACDLNTNTCIPGGVDAGSGLPVFDDAGMTARCLPFDAGAQMCSTECPKGYECISGLCKLRGSSGPVQITLRFNQPEDLDLHVVEPLADGGTCEIYYAQPGNTPPPPFPLPFPIPNCGARGWLDLDSNAACNIDNVDVENVIYSPGTFAPRGTYIVRVVYYQHCSANGPIPYEVEVRANGQTRFYCGQFQPNQANGGNQGAGTTITSFTLP